MPSYSKQFAIWNRCFEISSRTDGVERCPCHFPMQNYKIGFVSAKISDVDLMDLSLPLDTSRIDGGSQISHFDQLLVFEILFPETI